MRVHPLPCQVKDISEGLTFSRRRTQLTSNVSEVPRMTDTLDRSLEGQAAPSHSRRLLALGGQAALGTPKPVLGPGRVIGLLVGLAGTL
jgi:hypothetical protein